MEVLIIGAGAQAKYIIETAKLRGDFSVVGMIDIVGNETMVGKEYDGVSVLGGLEVIQQFQPADDFLLMIACPNNQKKEELARNLAGRGFSFHTAIHPTAVIASTATIGIGSIINPLSVIQPFVKIGDHCMIHSGVIIEHDGRIGNFVNIGPGSTLAGWVTVEPRAVLYTGSIAIPKVTVEEDAIVGAGAVVRGRVSANTTVVGIPAKPI